MPGLQRLQPDLLYVRQSLQECCVREVECLDLSDAGPDISHELRTYVPQYVAHSKCVCLREPLQRRALFVDDVDFALVDKVDTGGLLAPTALDPCALLYSLDYGLVQYLLTILIVSNFI